MTTYTKVFGGDTVRPSEIGYQAYALTANAAFYWPTEASTSALKTSRIMDVAATGAFVLSLPDATLTGVGESLLISNTGAFAFTVANHAGTPICTVAVGSSWYLYLTTNATANGTWSVFQFGATISSVNSAALAGDGLIAIGTTLSQSLPVTLLNANYTIGVTDRAEAFIWVGGAGTFTLPLAGTAGANWFCHFRNNGTGTLTLQCAGADKINGSSSLATDAGDSSIVVTDGSNFYTIGLPPSTAGAFSYLAIDLAGLSGDYTLSASEIDKVAYQFSGALGGAISIVVPSTVQEYWVDNTATGDTLDVGTSGQAVPVAVATGQRAILYCDGTNVVDADTASISTPISIANGGTAANSATNARINLGGTSTGIALFTATSAAAARSASSSPSTQEAIAFAIAL
jgi:hypothetical protein